MRTTWRPGMLGHWMVAALRIAPAVALAGILALGQLALADANPGNYFSLTMGACRIAGVTHSASTTVKVQWHTSSNTLRLSQTVTSHHHQWHTSCISHHLVAGDKLKMKVGSTTVYFKVPAFSARPNRVSDAVSGHAPTTGTAYLFVTHHGSPTSRVTYDAILAPNGSGNYSHDFTANGGIWGGDSVNGYWSDSHKNNITINVIVPQLKVLRGSSVVQGWLLPSSSATIKLRNSSHLLRGSAHVSTSSGSFSGRFTSGASHPTVNRGDIIDGTAVASDATLTVPDVRISGARNSHTVSGKCQSSAAFTVSVSHSNGSSFHTYAGVASGAGILSVHVSNALHKGDHLTVWCWQSTGDQIGRTGTVA